MKMKNFPCFPDNPKGKRSLVRPMVGRISLHCPGRCGTKIDNPGTQAQKK